MYLKHGRSALPEYKCWQQIKQRCLNPNHRAYPNYGGRGITIALEWVDDFEAFLVHVGFRPTPKHSLDRINNDRGYEPGNVRWVSWVEQNRNRRPHGTGATRDYRDTETRVTNFKHGMIHTPEYKVWSLMKDRCLNPKSSNYPRWGGRGITIYEPWIRDFTAFYEYMGSRPTPVHTLDRADNSKGYFPGNVRWATRLQQTQNRRPCCTGSSHGNFEHGHTGSPEYKAWGSIKTRCFNPKHDRYADYGGRGITMCSRWRESFEAFLADMGPKPSPEHTVSRLDHDGHYSCGGCPECQAKGWLPNCRWATKTEQNRNRKTTERTGKLTTGQVVLIRERLEAGTSQRVVAEEFGVCRSLVGKIGRGEVWA